MKLVEMKCKNCGAKLEVEEDCKTINCQYCHAKYKLDDEIQHIQYDNMEQSGYEFEKGRIRAQKEAESNKVQTVYVKNKNNKKNNSKKHGVLYYLVCLMLFPIIITYYVVKSEKLSKGGKIAILVVLWLSILIAGLTSNEEEKDLQEKPLSTDCTSIFKFDYYLDGDEVIIKEYEGSDKKIKICSTYEIDDKEYTVTKFSEGVFSLKSVYSVILPETLKSMPSNTFNSSEIKYVFIPKSLEVDKSSYPFYKYFHDVEVIYYGGSEEDWKMLTNNVDRSEIDAKNIVYDSSIDDLK